MMTRKHLNVIDTQERRRWHTKHGRVLKMQSEDNTKETTSIKVKTQWNNGVILTPN